MDIITWAIVGLIAGVLAALIVGGYGLLGDIVIGMIGALLGGWIFARTGWHVPVTGIAAEIFVAFVGAIVLLVVLHLVHAAMYGYRRPTYWRTRGPLP